MRTFPGGPQLLALLLLAAVTLCASGGEKRPRPRPDPIPEEAPGATR